MIEYDYCWGFTTYLHQYADRNLLLNLHDEIIKFNAIQSRGGAIQQNEAALPKTQFRTVLNGVLHQDKDLKTDTITI